MPSTSGLLESIELLYDKCGSSDVWPLFLERYAGRLRANLAVLHTHRLDRSSSGVLASFGLTSALRGLCNDHYSSDKALRDGVRRGGEPGTLLLDDHLCPRITVEQSLFVNEFIVPLGGAYSASAIVERTPEQAVVLTTLRGRRHGPWTPRELQDIRTLLPHVMRARELEQSAHLLSASLGALDTLDVGVILVRHPAEVVHANAFANAALSRGDGLSLASRTLVATDPRTDTLLRAALVAATGTTPHAEGSGAIAASRPSLRRAYQLMVSPLRTHTRVGKGTATVHAMIVLIDPDAKRTLSPRALEALYGLTKREAALAVLLACGEPLPASSRALGIQYETARSHLRRIFDKTGTSRQGELMVLLAQVSALGR